MAAKDIYRLCYIFFVAVVLSCTQDDGYDVIEPEPISPVVFDLNNVPFEKLSDYNFYEGDLANLRPVYGVLPYSLNSTLFTDYAKKKRFIWMPKGVTASYISDHDIFDFPTGTVLIKNFYYENVLPDHRTKILETRLMIKLEGEWIFANYVWNEEQNEAFFTGEGSYVPLSWQEGGETLSVTYRIPSFSRCFACHGDFSGTQPIGTKPQNMNRMFEYNDGVKNQLTKLVEQGYLNSDYPSTIVSTVKWEDESQPLNLRARSYLDINCAHCHTDQGYCDYAQMRFAFKETESLEKLGVCVPHDFYLNEEVNHIITPGEVNSSALYVRLTATEEDVRMPLLGRTLVHQEGISLIEQWINSLNFSCD